jgi:hypothetical protein
VVLVRDRTGQALSNLRHDDSADPAGGEGHSSDHDSADGRGLLPSTAAGGTLVLLPPLDFAEAPVVAIVVMMVVVVVTCAGRHGRRLRSAMVIAVPKPPRRFDLSEEVDRLRYRARTEAAQKGRCNDRHGEFWKEGNDETTLNS